MRFGLPILPRTAATVERITQTSEAGLRGQTRAAAQVQTVTAIKAVHRMAVAMPAAPGQLTH